MLHRNPQDIPHFRRPDRIAPLGYFAMGVGWVRVAPSGAKALVIANGSDWTPQPLTLHFPTSGGGYEKIASWFSDDYDHHMGLAVADITGNGYDDVVVTVFAGRDQSLSNGGVKVYLGGPNGLDPQPHWLARGFAATGVAIAPLGRTSKPDIVVSCLCEGGTIQEPSLEHDGSCNGRARLLLNSSTPGARVPSFKERIIEHPAARGAGDVQLADIDLDGTLDVLFAGPRTGVLYGRHDSRDATAWAAADSWVSEEKHPFSFGAGAFLHPRFPEQMLIASSRGIFSMQQLAGRSLDELDPGIYIHSPTRSPSSKSPSSKPPSSRFHSSPALQRIAHFDATQSELPAGLTAVHDALGWPYLIAGSLDTRARDIRGVPLRVYRSQTVPDELPFFDVAHDVLPGSRLMAARITATLSAENPTAVSEHRFETGPSPQNVITLPHLPAGEVLGVEVKTARGASLTVSFFQVPGTSAVVFTQELPARTRIMVKTRRASELEIAATSSAAWPPAGASSVWRGHLDHAFQSEESTPDACAQQAG